MKTKAICPKCGSSDLSWNGGIATCHGWALLRTAPGRPSDVSEPCTWRGTYPKRIEVEEGE